MSLVLRWGIEGERERGKKKERANNLLRKKQTHERNEHPEK